MSTNIRDVPCEHCGALRNTDKKIACPLCGSKEYPLIGYNYAHEARAIMVMASIIGAVVLLAILAGALFVIYTILALTS